MAAVRALTMSISRVRRMDACPQREWWHSEGAWEGWSPTADATTREAWSRRCATSLTAALGQGIHMAAAAIARAYRDGRRPPDYAECLTLVRTHLATLWRARDVEAFRRDPRRDGMLLERLDGGDVSVSELQSIKVRLPSLVRRLVSHSVWEQVRECGRADIVICDSLDAMLWEIAGVPVKLYAAPDLCFITRAPIEVARLGVPIPAATPVLVDWKTGRGSDYLPQLALYAWYVRDHLGLPPGPLGYAGWIGELASAPQEPLGDHLVLIGDGEIQRARSMIERAVRQVTGWTGPDGRLVRDRMPLVEASCRFCPFRRLCDAGAGMDRLPPAP